MIKHMVFWKLKDEAMGNDKWENARIIKERLEALPGIIPGLIENEVGLNLNGGEYDAALYSVFISREALRAYDTHPEHLKVRAFVSEARISRAVVDYEI
jgi:hypothetical protein